MPRANLPTKVVGVLIARMDSSRLQGKVMMEVGGKPLIDLVHSRVSRSKFIDQIALATTNRSCDDVLAAHAETLHCNVWRGDLSDVASRVLRCAEALSATHFVRINGDSPFVDPNLIDEGISLALETQADLVTNLMPRSYPYGVAVEVVKVAAFRNCLPRFSPSNREHVTQYFYQNPNDISIQSLPLAERPGLPDVRLTIDEPGDVSIIRSLAAKLGQRLVSAGYDEVASLALKREE